MLPSLVIFRNLALCVGSRLKANNQALAVAKRGGFILTVASPVAFANEKAKVLITLRTTVNLK